MNKFNRTLAVILTLVLFATGMVSSFNAYAAEAYICDITINKIKNGCFEYMAYDVTNKSFYRLETEAKATWSPDWPGHFVPNKDIYTVSKSERDGGLVDLMCNLNEKWASVVMFTAPKDGKFNIVADLVKFSGVDSDGLVCYVDVMLVKASDNTVLMKQEKIDFAEIKWVKKNVELAEGESVYIIVLPNSESTKSSSQNVALMSFIVNESVEQSSQITTDPNQMTTPDTTTDPDTTTEPGITDVPDNTGDIENKNDGEKTSEKINPIVIAAIVGGVIILASVVTIVILNVKRKK